MNKKISLGSKKFKAYLATQFFDSFNDNAFRVMISLLAIKVITDASQASRMVSLASGLFVAPFILFSAYSGYLADRYSKKTIMVWSKFLEIVVMFFGLLALSRESLPFLLIVLFLNGAQSTLFSPSKFGILPEIFTDEDLTRANGRVQMWTFVAVILGTAWSGQLFKLVKGNVGRTGIFFMGVSVIAFFTSFFIPSVSGAGSEKPFEVNFLKVIKNTLLEVRKSEALFLCVIGSVYLWFLGALLEMNILIYAKHFMQLSESQTSYLLGVLALGIGLGGIAAGRFSGEKVEFGLVPLGAFGMGVFCLLLYFSRSSPILTGLFIFILGISGGLYVIPLNSYVQQKCPKDSLGKILALENFLTFSGILSASLVYYLFTQIFKMEAPTIFLVLGLASFIVISYIMKKLPDFLLRFLIWLLTHTIYNIRIVGQEHVPKEGGALLVCNHVSVVDAFLVTACIQRFIRFVMYRKFYEIKALNPFCRLMKAIPVAMEDNPKQLIRSIQVARRFLAEGELVCIFAEGEMTRTGQMLSFKKGLEIINKGSNTPIIPVYLDRVWGSIFSFHRGKYFKKIPVKIPYPVTVAFGPPLPPASEAFLVRQAIAELGAEAFRYRKNDQELLSTRFYIQAKKSPLKPCMADSQGTSLNYWRALVASMSLSRVLARKYSQDKYLGILLPPSIGAALTNIAISITGKIPVNINYTSSEESRQRAVEQCGIRHVFTSRSFIEKSRL